VKFVKRLVSVLVLVAAASFLGGCGTSTSPASVNGQSIDGEQFLDQLAQLSKFNFGDDKTVSSVESANRLTQYIFSALISDEMKRLGLSVSDADVAAQRDAVLQSVKSIVDANEGRDGVLKDSFINYVARVQAEEAALVARITDTDDPWFTDDDVRAYYDFVKESQYHNYCTHHILVATEADASTIKSQLDNGADFEQIAKERSTDTGSAPQGGDLGCVKKGDHVPEFENAVLQAAEGDTIGPIQTPAGFHVIRIDREYSIEELDDALRAEIGATLNTESGWAVWKIYSSKIEVNPRYGTWSNDAQSVSPRADPTVK
jgi:parvulin-like peptidyl-prolyl isomerase